jgi:hypothetical protein
MTKIEKFQRENLARLVRAKAERERRETQSSQDARVINATVREGFNHRHFERVKEAQRIKE